MNNIKHIRKRSIGILIILLFLISILTPFIDLSGLKARNVNAPPKTSSNCLFNGKLYTFNLDDFYDDEDLTKIWTGAKFQTEASNDTTYEWTGVVNNDTVTPVNNTETQYGDPSNINMINGTTDSADNMKINDASYTTFTSTHTDGYIYETPSQWDNFTFTEGTGGVIGEIETIDANYSTLISTAYIPPPDEFINSITYTWATDGGGTLEDTHIDDSNYKRANSKTSFDLWWIEITLNFDPALAGRDFYISAHIDTSGGNTGRLKINGVDWKTGIFIDFDDELRTGVTSITFITDKTAGSHYSLIYYFKIVEDLPGTPADLDVQVDIQVDDPDLSSIEFLKFSHKTNISVTMDLDIWNWDTTTWYEIESIDNSATFDDDSFTLGSGSDYVSETNQVRIRFQATSSSGDFELQIDRLRLDYLTTPAELEMEITFSFSNYNKDLLAMTIQSWQKTNISQTITFKIWNYDTESYVQISSSSDTTFTKKEYNTESPSNFISPSGVVKLYWVGSDIINDFELHIDYLFIQIYYKLDLVHSKSFDTNGIWRYRWAVLGSIHYTQWVNFEVIDPIPNFHAISESDATTRWILQNATLTPLENFTDDISGSNWYLHDVSEETFVKSPTESINYLLDNYTIASPTWRYITTCTMEYGTQSGTIANAKIDDGNYFTLTSAWEPMAGVWLAYTNNLGFNIAPDGSAQNISYYLWSSSPDVRIYINDISWKTGNPHLNADNQSHSGVSSVIFRAECESSFTIRVYYFRVDSTNVAISKKYQGSGYMYMQTNITEAIALQSTTYGTNYTLSSGDYFTIDFQTSSDSQINLILLKDGVVNKTLILSQSGNTNFNRHTAQISVDENVEFDQLKISSTFEDTDYFRCYDIKTYKYTIIGDYEDFYVGSKRTEDVYMTPDTYNLRIFEEGTKKIDTNITISGSDYYYIYEPIQTQYCRIALFSVEGNYLNLEDYHVKLNRSLNGEYNQFWLLENLFYVDVDTYVYIDIYDRFNSLIDSFERLVSDYIDLEIEVYSLQIKNLQTQKTTIDINTTHVYPLLSGESIYFMLSKQYYQIGYYDEYDLYKDFTIYLNSNKAYQLNSSLKTIYFSMFTYDGFGIDHDLVRFYINDKRRDFGFYSTLEDSLNLVILDFFNNTLANETIDANAYDNSEYNLFVEIYSLIILNQFTYEDIIVNITQVGSGVWMTQIIPKQFGFMYRFLPNIEYNITVYFTNATLYNSRVINLTNNSQIESFGEPTLPEEYPKNVYFGVYTSTGLGINHDLVRFYIDNVRTDFGFNRIENMIILLTVKDYFNSTLFNQYVNTSGIYEYNILITLFSLKIKNEARETSNYTLKLGGLETTGLILPQEIIEYQLSSNNYVFEFTNNEDDSFHTININLNENKVYIINSTYYTTYFGLFDQYNHRLDNSLFSLYLNGTRKDFGFIELSSEYYNITVYDWLNVSVFDQIIYLFTYTEYNIYITVFEFQIRHLATENSNFSLYETTSGNYINFSMAPDTITSYMLSSSTYNVSWTNGEDLQTSYYYITLDSNYILTLSSTYYNIFFSLNDLNLHIFHPYQYEFRLNNTIQDFGFIEDLQTDDYNITVKDRFGTYLFNNIVNLRGLNEYRIDIALYELQIRHLATENSDLTLTEDVSSNNYSFIMSPNSIKSIVVGSADYTLNWINGENNQITLFPINLIQDRVIMLNTTYYMVYFSLYDQGSVRLDDSLFSLYINNTRKDFGFIELESDDVLITVYDRLNVTVFNQIVALRNYAEYNIYVTVFELQIKNLQIQQTTIDINSTLYVYPLLSGESIYFMLSKNYYQIGYYDTNDVYKQFLIYLNSNQAYELNRSQICILIYADQQGNYLVFETYKTYLNESRIYTNSFYGEIGDIVGIEIKDRYDISIKNDTLTVVSGVNEKYIVLTLYSLKVMSQQLCFNHINITRDPNYYESDMYWSEWIAPNEIIEFRLFAGYYKINLTNNEAGSSSYYSYTLSGDDILLIGSNNTIYNVLVNIANVNATIGNQITNVQIDLTNQNSQINNSIINVEINLGNINSSLGNMLVNLDVDITNIANNISTLYVFTENSFINLGNDINVSFISIENNIISINQSISNLVIGVSNDIYLINGTISTMITQLETNLLLMNVSIDTALFDLDTTLNLIGSNITSNFILLNNSIYLNNLNINDSRIAIINNLLLINNTITTLISEVYSAVYLINNSIYTAVVDLGTYLSLMNNTISGNLSIVLEMNDFLTEIYKMTMFSDLLNWTNIGLNTSLITTQIDVWTFINHYVNQSVEVHLRYQDLIEKLAISADDFRDQWLPNKDVEYNLWSVVDGKYVDEWKTLDPENKTVNFGFYEEKVPDFPSFDNTSITIVLIILIFIGVIGLSTYFVYKYNKRVQNLKVAYARQHTIDKDLIDGVSGRSPRMKKIK